jgi:hypothetical protein
MDKWMNNGLVWLAVVWGALLLAFCLMGCRTKSVVEFVEVHDTLRTVQTDTVREVRVVTKTDTIKQMENHILTVNERGDTIREVHFYHEREKTIVVDSTNRYQSKIDSLQSIIDRMSTKEVVKEPWFWAWGWKILAGIVAAIIFIIRLKN